MSRMIAVLFALVLAVSACGDDVNDADLVDAGSTVSPADDSDAGDDSEPDDDAEPGDEDPTTAGDCVASEPDCDDTVTPDDGEIPNDDIAGMCIEGATDCDDTVDGEVPDDNIAPLPTDGALSVADALTTDATGILAVTGYVVASGDEAVFCDALAESYPPQCGGDTMPISGIDLASETDADDVDSTDDTYWTSSARVLYGEVVDGAFVVDPTTTG